MALTLEPATSGTAVDVDEYVRHVREHVALDDTDAVLASADMLLRLARNPAVVADRLNAELAACADTDGFQPLNDYSAQSFLLGRGPGFAVRANLWLPPVGTAAQRRSTHELNSYQQPHDHDFSFLTVGYWGSGYATSIYEYDPASLTGVLGERVDMQFLEHTTLPPGKIMFYRASRDIHTQEYPDEPSMSVNLLLAPRRAVSQYTFDLERGTVCGIVDNNAETGVGLCAFARYVGDATTAARLDRLAASHPLPRLRWAAYESLRELVPGEDYPLLLRAAGDEHEQVRRLARAALDRRVPAGAGGGSDGGRIG